MKKNKSRLSLLLTIAMCGLIATACSDTSTQASAPSGSAAKAASAPLPTGNRAEAAPIAAYAAASAPSQTGVRVPAGTRLVVRMIDSVNSKSDHVGDTFTASLDQPLDVNGTIVARRGARVYGKLEQVKSAGKIKGQSELRLALTGIEINGSTHPITTGSYEVRGKSRGKNTAKKVGIGAAIGGAIGAIAGGGKGAAIGAGIGAGAGTAAQVLTHGQQINVPSETVLDFTIEQPVRLPITNA
jgi:pectin methylesterase-like acyl-CoA thioesterase